MSSAPSLGNEHARERFAQNRFTVTRQLRYSRDEAQRALDIGLFINGLPAVTFELKNNLTKQTVGDAVEQYRKDRNPREKLFDFGRCVAHFAVDESDVRFCTHLQGKASWFLPFNRGWNDGAGNPPNSNGLKADYLWRDVLTRESLTDIIENYAEVVESREEKPRGKRSRGQIRKQIWPRSQTIIFCVPPGDDAMPSASRIARCLGSGRVALRTGKVLPSARLNVAVTRWRPASVRRRVVQRADRQLRDPRSASRSRGACTS